jgi:hypothetical protein
MIEEILEGIKTRLVSGLPPQLAIIDNQMKDGNKLDLIEETNIFLSELGNYQSYPLIILIGDTTNTNYKMNAKNDLHSIILSCAVCDTDEVVLAKKLYRYMVAIRRVIEANNFLQEFSTTDGNVIQLLIDSYSYSPMFMGNETDSFLKDCSMKLTATERLLMGT